MSYPCEGGFTRYSFGYISNSCKKYMTAAEFLAQVLTKGRKEVTTRKYHTIGWIVQELSTFSLLNVCCFDSLDSFFFFRFHRARGCGARAHEAEQDRQEHETVVQAERHDQEEDLEEG